MVHAVHEEIFLSFYCVLSFFSFYTTSLGLYVCITCVYILPARPRHDLQLSTVQTAGLENMYCQIIQ